MEQAERICPAADAASADVLHSLGLEAIVAMDQGGVMHVVKTTYVHHADTECGPVKMPMLRFFWSVEGPRSVQVAGVKRCKPCYQISAVRAARKI